MKTLFLLSLHCALVLCLSSIALAATPGEVMVVYNTESSLVTASRGVAEYYAMQRRIPQQNLLGIETWAGESVSDSNYVNSIATPISNYLSQLGNEDIKVIVLCYGIPYCIDVDAPVDRTSIDSALTFYAAGTPGS